jgi:prevent-host-death family protein
MAEAQLKDVKAGFSAVVERARQGEPTVVTRHGEKVAVVLGFEEWQRLTKAGTDRRPDLVDHLLAFPDVGLDWDALRDRRPARNPFEDELDG